MEFEKLQQIIAEVLNIEPDEITMNTTFVDDLGADSLDVFQIIMESKRNLILRFRRRKRKRSPASATRWKQSRML